MMMALGPFRFSIVTASYQALKKTVNYQWVSTSRIAKEPLLQYTGKSEEQIDLEGVIYPHFKGGLEQITSLKKVAELKKPHLLIDGLGHVHGRWVIHHIEEQHSFFFENGIPKKMEFRLSLTRYGE